MPERVTATLLPFVALAVGYGLAAVAASAASMGGSARLAPVVMIALPLAPLAVLGVLADARLAVIGTLALTPVGTMHVGPLPVQLIIAVVLAFAGLVALPRLRAGLSPVAWSPPLWWMLALVAWTILGFPRAVDGALAIRQIAQLVGAILFATLVLAACSTRRDVRVVAGGFLAVSFFVGLLAVAGGHQLQTAYGGAVVNGRAQGSFAQPNELGSYCAPFALLAMAMAVAGATSRVRLASAAAALALIAAMALSLSRGAWIGFALGSVVLVAMLPAARRAMAVIMPLLLLLALGLGAFAPSNPQVEVIGARLKSISGEQNPYDSRPAIWAEARREIKTHPLFGTGAGDFPVSSVAATSKSRTTYAEHAHNIILTWAAETGLPGAGLILALAGHAGWLAWRARRRIGRTGRAADLAVLAGSAAALVAVLGQGLVDYTLRNSVIMVSVFGLIGLLLAAVRVADAGPPDTQRSS